MAFTFTKQFTGMEIAPTAIRMAIVEKSGKTWRLVKGASIPLPEGTIKPSFKSPNIVEPKLFLEAVQRLLTEFEGTARTVGLSLPSEIVRILIRGYPKLPDSRAEIEKLISWSLEKSFHFPIENTKVSYQVTGSDVSGHDPPFGHDCHEGCHSTIRRPSGPVERGHARGATSGGELV